MCIRDRSYDLDGGTAVDGETYDEENVKPGETITVKAAPTRNGYTFDGWYDGTEPHQPGDNVIILDAALKLTAQWKKDLNPTNPTDPTNPTKPTEPTDPTRPTDPTTSSLSLIHI